MIASRKAFNHVCYAAVAPLLLYSYHVVVCDVNFFALRVTTDPTDAWRNETHIECDS